LSLAPVEENTRKSAGNVCNKFYHFNDIEEKGQTLFQNLSYKAIKNFTTALIALSITFYTLI
jgi:hypothetical protein